MGGIDAFILGCERSGTTWLSNILDSHPGVEFFMEPWSEQVDLFPGFPSRNDYLTVFSPELKESLGQGLSRLDDLKHPFCYRPGRPTVLKRLDWAVVRAALSCARLSHVRAPRRVLRYHELNLNTRELPVHLHTRKRAPLLRVVKELRLNFKVPALAEHFPAARFIVIARHPGAQISSILRLFSVGRLIELNRGLPDFFERAARAPRFEAYRTTLLKGAQGGLEHRLAAWWFVTYDVLIEDLRATRCPFKLVHHEQASQSPQTEAESVLDFLGLSPDAEVDEFVKISSSTVQEEDPVSTFRQSAAHSRQTIADVPGSVSRAVEEVLGCAPESAWAAPYR